jgi:hypothetical protein
MGLKGLARVMFIRPSPKIKPGAGRVVLMTVTHVDQGVMEIEFAGLKKALEPTVNHPLFSADRNDWVPAGQLRIGERVKTRTGNSGIKTIRWKTGEHRVYNIEVEADHAYFVSQLDLLSHNAGCNKAALVKANKATGDSARDAIAARTGGVTEQNFNVTGGSRRVDVLDGSTAIESKVGRTGLTARTRQELARDVKNKRAGNVDKNVWEFSPSPVTGKSGPTKKLRGKLEKHGIEIVEN